MSPSLVRSGQSRAQRPGLHRVLSLVIIMAGATALAGLVHLPPTGKIQGIVRDQAGAPIINAQVSVVGTGIGTLSGDSGRYRLNNVPVGRVSVRAAFVGYKTAVVQGVRVLAGQTVTQDIQLEQTPFQLEEITMVLSETARLVPRDEVTSRQRLSGNYLDGAPVTEGYRGTGYSVGTNAFEQSSVTTGAASGELGNAQSGIISLQPEREQHNREQYARIYDNRFLASGTNPLSTFSIDVDAASYSNIRRFLTGGQAPPPDAVRIEEMINYFDYEYKEPEDGQPFSVTTEVTDAPWNPAHKLVLVGLQGKRMSVRELPPSNLVFLLDVSGSMNEPDKLPLVQSAFRLLVNQLRTIDRVAIVVYAGAAGVVLPSTPGSQKDSILGSIDRLRAGGSTAGGAGIRLAYQVAKENFIAGGNNRVILATDGDFNVGVSSDAELVRLIEEKRTEGTFLTVLGFGTGNLQDAKMEQLADKGNGNYAYVDNLREAQKVFVHEMGGTLFTIAKDVKIQVEFNPVQVASYRLIGYENRVLRAEDFNDDTKDAGELGAGHSVTALYEIVPAKGKLDVDAGEVDPLRYQNVLRPNNRYVDELLTVKLRYKLPDGDRSRLLRHSLTADTREASDNIKFASAVAAFGMLLRNSEHRGSADPALVLGLARASLENDEFGYRAEFIRLVERYTAINTTALRE